MPLRAYGPLVVPSPGTKVAVTSVIPADELREAYGPFKVHGVLFQALSTNGGAVTVYQLQADGSYEPVAVLGAPTTNFIPSFSAALTAAANSVGVTDLYLDAATPGEGVLFTVLIA